MNFSEFEIDFLSAHVTWRNLEHPIARLIVTVDRHLEVGVRGALSLVFESF